MQQIARTYANQQLFQLILKNYTFFITGMLSKLFLKKRSFRKEGYWKKLYLKIFLDINFMWWKAYIHDFTVRSFVLSLSVCFQCLGYLVRKCKEIKQVIGGEESTQEGGNRKCMNVAERGCLSCSRADGLRQVCRGGRGKSVFLNYSFVTVKYFYGVYVALRPS